MAITADAVKELRELTGAGIMDSKRALEETGGDLDKAVALLRERGVAAAEKKSGREAREGLVSSYIHTGGRIGVLVEVNCETDFVARTEQFQTLVRNIAIQVAGLRPLYVSVESIPAEELEAKKADLLADPATQARPENVRDKIVEGQLNKRFFGEAVLTEQTWYRADESTGTVAQYLKEHGIELLDYAWYAVA
jgi:elongation factor Ts